MAGIEIPNLLEEFKSSLIKDNVDIITFAEDPKYLGRVLYPRQRTMLKIIFLQDLDDYDRKVIAEWEADSEIEVCPKLEERIQYLKDNGHEHFRIVQLVGGRRSSKGFVTAIAIAYKVYRMTQIEDISKEYGIAKAKSIYFSIVGASLDEVKAHQFADARDAVIETRPLQAQRLLGQDLAETITVYTPDDRRRQAQLRASGMKADRDMGSLIIKAHGTNSRTIRGSAAMMFVFDEMAHLVAGESRMSDEDLWTAAIPSVNQFGRHGMIFANSSPWQKTGKFYEIYENALQLDPPEVGDPVFPDIFMMRYPSWTLYKDWETQPGCPPPQIDDPAIDPIIAREEKADPDSFAVEYRARFAEVINAFLRAEYVDRMFDPANHDEILGRELRPTVGAMSFLRYKGHGDPASVGANFGIAIGHIEDVEVADTDEHGDPVGSTHTEQHVIFDFVDAFYPDDFPNGTIDWLTVIPEITTLINSYRPFEFSFDQFDSRMALQQLEQNMKELGIGETMLNLKHATNASNERRWKNFRAAMNLNRVHIPHPSTFNPMATRNSLELARNELKFLQEKSGKVDKQSVGPIQTKDIADCIAEVVDALIGDTIGLGGNLTARPQFGAQGGWNMAQGNLHQFPELADIYERRKMNHAHMPERGRKTNQRYY